VDSEILHSCEGGDVERWFEPRNKFFVFAIACLLIFISLYCLYLCCWFTCTLCSILALHSSLRYTHHSLLLSILISIRRQLSTSTH